MIERLFIHNYKGFVNFEMKFGRIVLLAGRNGTGKSSLVDVLHDLVMVIFNGSLDAFAAEDRNRFDPSPTQLFELDVRLSELTYQYRLDLRFDKTTDQPSVVRERLSSGDAELFSFEDGKYRVASEPAMPSRPRDASEGALAPVFDGLPEEFREWVQGFLLLRLVPSEVKAGAKRPGDSLSVDASDFVAFYDAVANDDTQVMFEYQRAMRNVLPGLLAINLKTIYKGGKLWEAEFQSNGSKAAFTLEELSHGQICLVILYAVLHFYVRKGKTVALDEPDNYLALSEIEPLLHEFEDAADENRGQVFLISHHPEIYNRWATDPERCRHLIRTEDGRFVAQPINWDEHSGLMPAEVVARGWEDG